MWLVLKGNKDCYDFTQGGENGRQVCEALICGKNINNIIGGNRVLGGYDIAYSMFCYGNNSNLFGCIGLRNKQYCILNKQYTKAEYEALVPKIIEHMNKQAYIDKNECVYSYGDFFPTELSQFSYNETSAQELFPMKKHEAEASGLSWKNIEEKKHIADIKNEDIPDNINEVDEGIISKVIECKHRGMNNEQCTGAFRIVSQELQFYKKMNLPLPRLCPNCRHHERLIQRNPLKLWHRKCMKPGCANEFETSYNPGRPEIIYCEQCYTREIA